MDGLNQLMYRALADALVAEDDEAAQRAIEDRFRAWQQRAHEYRPDAVNLFAAALLRASDAFSELGFDPRDGSRLGEAVLLDSKARELWERYSQALEAYEEETGDIRPALERNQ